MNNYARIKIRILETMGDEGYLVIEYIDQLKTDLELARAFNQTPDVVKAMATLKAREEVAKAFKK